MAIILGLDPGFSNVGWAIAEVSASGYITPYAMGVFETEKSDKKKNVLATDDNFRRSREIARFLADLIENETHGYKDDDKVPDLRPELIAAESMSFPRNSSVAAKMAYSWGILASISETRNLPVVQVTPQALKKALTGNKSAEKADIAAAMNVLFGLAYLEGIGLGKIPKSKREHPYDALGAIVACKDAELVRVLRGKR
jgi:crossover junction endodeoxyribonuclease RuvC